MDLKKESGLNYSIEAASGLTILQPLELLEIHAELHRPSSPGCINESVRIFVAEHVVDVQLDMSVSIFDLKRIACHRVEVEPLVGSQDDSLSFAVGDKLARSVGNARKVFARAFPLSAEAERQAGQRTFIDTVVAPEASCVTGSVILLLARAITESLPSRRIIRIEKLSLKRMA